MSESDAIFDLMGFTGDDCEFLRSQAAVIERELPRILDEFYKTVSKHEDLADMFSSPQRMAYAQSAQAARGY